jgi:hypothetical protein
MILPSTLRLRRAAATLLIGATLASTTGCYGRFALASSLHKWNGTVSNKWVNSLVFFGLVIVQAYSICLLGDGLIFNTIEFWTGSNPIAKNVRPDGTIELEKDGVQLTLAPDGEGRWRLEQDGALVAEAESRVDGAIVLTDARTGRTVVVPGEEARDLIASAPLARH